MDEVNEMNNMIIRLQEDLEMINEKIKEYERKSYDIFSNTTMVNDRVEYDRLIGQRRGVELAINVIQSELKEQEIAQLISKIEEATR